MVKYLIEHGADFNKINSLGDTILSKACKNRNEHL